MEEEKTYGFGTTCGRVNKDQILISGWTIPLTLKGNVWRLWKILGLLQSFYISAEDEEFQLSLSTDLIPKSVAFAANTSALLSETLRDRERNTNKPPEQKW